MNHSAFSIFRITRKVCAIASLAIAVVMLLLLEGCSAGSDRFKMEGRFLHFNQGQLYVYSPDGGIDGLDTINVKGGRFVYETTLRDPSTLVIVFPNYSEQPIFAEPGEAVTVKADASHLREMEVSGTKANKLMTDFRQLLAKNSPMDAPRLTAEFVKEHPESRVGLYLVSTYLVGNDTPDYASAIRLIDLMLKEQPRNGELVSLRNRLSKYQQVKVGNPLPAFKAMSTDGQTVTQRDFAKGNGVVLVWATWSSEGMEQLRTLNELKKQDPTCQILTVCVDASRATCERVMRQAGISLPTVCDGRMLDCPLLAQLSLNYLPDNIIVEKGVVKARTMSSADLRRKYLEH